jgi:hypothetical protein
MRFLILAFLPAGLLAGSSNAQVSSDVHNMCLRAADYSGCVLQQNAAKGQNPEEARSAELRQAIIRMAEERQRQNHQLMMELQRNNPYADIPTPLDYMQYFSR